MMSGCPEARTWCSDAAVSFTAATTSGSAGLTGRASKKSSELHGARARLERRSELLRAGTASTLWAILDQVVDSYAPVVAELDRDIEQIEATVFSGVVAPTERIYFLRREVTDFYRAVHPLLAVLSRQLQPGKYPALPEEAARHGLDRPPQIS
ncbi:CorA family divalent cation transporter [Streptomyces sp. NPDC057565]|uniref:CorA family divalent cation transporter n=1 Tax=Streptomyces sp. NPDC057565 TaxID=3346169 RepID=UPI0036AA38B0